MRAVRLVHISDLHFGASDPAALECLAAALNESNADALVVTGDITQAGREREYLEAAAYFQRFTVPFMTIPGNHDAPVFSPILRMTDPWRRFRRILNTETGAILDLHDARVIGLNSARRGGAYLDWSKGRLSAEQIEGASKASHSAPPGALRVVALHHPMLPAQGVAGQAVVGRAAKALDAFAEAGVDLILTGHVHLSSAKTHGPFSRAIIMVGAGTASSTRVRGEAPSFNLIEGDKRRLSVSIFTYQADGYNLALQRLFKNDARGWRQEDGPENAADTPPTPVTPATTMNG